MRLHPRSRSALVHSSIDDLLQRSYIRYQTYARVLALGRQTGRILQRNARILLLLAAQATTAILVSSTTSSSGSYCYISISSSSGNNSYYISISCTTRSPGSCRHLFLLLAVQAASSYVSTTCSPGSCRHIFLLLASELTVCILYTSRS